MKSKFDITEKKRSDYTEGSIIKSILVMGLPSMFGFLAQHVYAMTDMYWVSQLPGSEEGVAAITFFNNLMWVMFSFNSLIGPGSVAIISRRYGEKDFDLAETAIKETIILKLFFGFILGVVGLIFVPQLLALLGAEGEVLDMGVGYGRILLFGLPIMYATYSIFTALRGIANPAWSMGLMITSSLLNLILDPILIFGHFGFPAMGLNGAAYASVASFVTIFTAGMILFSTDKFNIKVHILRLNNISIDSMWKMVKIGIPAWIGELSFSGSRMMITPIVAGFGTIVVAAYGVGMQVYAFGIMLLVGMGLGLSSLIGHNLGASKIERAKTTANKSILMGMGALSVIAIIIFFFGEFYMNLFFDNPETIKQGVLFLRITMIGYPVVGAFIVLEMIHSGVGLNTPFMIISFIHSWGLQVLPALIVTEYFGLDQTAVWIVLTSAAFVTTSGFYGYYRKGRWLTVKV